MSLHTIPVTEFRQKTVEILNKITATNQPFYLLQRSHPKAVVMNVPYFESLMEELEDLRDMQVIEAAKATYQPQATVPLRDSLSENKVVL